MDEDLQALEPFSTAIEQCSLTVDSMFPASSVRSAAYPSHFPRSHLTWTGVAAENVSLTHCSVLSLVLVVFFVQCGPAYCHY